MAITLSQTSSFAVALGSNGTGSFVFASPVSSASLVWVGATYWPNAVNSTVLQPTVQDNQNANNYTITDIAKIESTGTPYLTQFYKLNISTGAGASTYRVNVTSSAAASNWWSVVGRVYTGVQKLLNSTTSSGVSSNILVGCTVSSASVLYLGNAAAASNSGGASIRSTMGGGWTDPPLVCDTAVAFAGPQITSDFISSSLGSTGIFRIVNSTRWTSMITAWEASTSAAARPFDPYGNSYVGFGMC